MFSVLETAPLFLFAGTSKGEIKKSWESSHAITSYMNGSDPTLLDRSWSQGLLTF